MEIEQEAPRVLTINRNKIGRVRINREAIMKGYVGAVFAHIKATPLHMETFFHNDSIEYTLYSEIFPYVGEGMITPEYKFEIKISTGCNVTSVEAVLI